MATRQKTRTTSAGKSRTTKRKAVETIFESYGLPGWLGWGTMGAESTYGTNGSYAFGGIDLPNSGGNSWVIEAQESAKAYAGLKKQYGSLPVAVEHYSGNSYQIGHVEELARGGASQGRETGTVQTATDPKTGQTVYVGFFGHLLESIPGVGPTFKFGHQAGEALGVEPLKPVEESLSDPLGGLQSIEQAGSAVTAFLSMLTDVKFWIRVGEAIGAFILIYMGLRTLTGIGPSPTSVASTAAATKGL